MSDLNSALATAEDLALTSDLLLTGGVGRCLVWEASPVPLPAVDRGGVEQRRVLDLVEHRSVSGSGRPRGALKPSKEVGGEAPYIFGWF